MTPDRAAAERTSTAFSPTLQVLTAEPPAPRPPELSFAAVIDRFPGVAEAEAVGWSGSTAAGWGNALSDVDLYVFSDREIEMPVDETMETWPSTDKGGVGWLNWMGRYGDVCADVQVWRTDALATVLAPYLAAAEPEFCGMSDALRDFVYRLSIAVPLKNEEYFREMRDLIERSSYRRSLARSLKSIAENRLIDVVGQLAVGDDVTARLTAGIAATLTVDHCLVLAGNLCRGDKWLVRRLESTPHCGVTVDDYRSTVLGGARQGESDRECALRIARWAQAHLIRVEEIVLTSQ
ncbi:MAG TPA: hypothetical protein VJ851_00945 [Jatrophihabitans sp.]|nr:hypothetical protein [Jatrophihabitans sp.]